MILNFGISEHLRTFRYPIFTAEFGHTKRTAPGVTGTVLSVQDQAVSSTLFLPASSFCLKRPLALKPGMEVDSSWLETLVLGVV